MIGRLLATCGWLAWQVRRPFRARRLSGLRRAAPLILAVALLVAGAMPIVLPLLDPQPEDATVQEIVDDAVGEPTGWVRLGGRVVPFDAALADRPGEYALLLDAANPLDAIVVRADRAPQAADSTLVTGHVTSAIVLVDEEELPIAATVAGTPPQIVAGRILELDTTPKPARVIPWPLAIPPLVLATLLFIGARVGYPLFRPNTEVDVLSVPLGPGERLPAAWGGRIGPDERELADPGGALLDVRPGERGNVLTVQALPDDGGPPPPPVTIGGGWASGRTGDVYAVSETVPALLVRSELVNATFLFARPGERNRVAALLGLDRG